MVWASSAPWPARVAPTELEPASAAENCAVAPIAAVTVPTPASVADRAPAPCSVEVMLPWPADTRGDRSGAPGAAVTVTVPTPASVAEICFIWPSVAETVAVPVIDAEIWLAPADTWPVTVTLPWPVMLAERAPEPTTAPERVAWPVMTAAPLMRCR